MTYQLVVMFQQRDVPPGFPGEKGSLAIWSICPPHDEGEFRIAPQMVVGGWEEKINEPETIDLPHQKLLIPDIAVLSRIEGIATADSLYVWRYSANPATPILDLWDRSGISLMSISFQGNLLQFRYRSLLAEMNCEWASLRLGWALFHWEPGRISISYFSTSAEGICEKQRVDSDSPLTGVADVVVSPGENLAHVQLVCSSSRATHLPFVVAICLISPRPLDPAAIATLHQRYGEEIRKIVGIAGQDSGIVGMFLSVRNATIDEASFERWRSKLGYPPGWGGMASAVLIAPDTPRGMLEDIQSIQAYSALQQVARDIGELHEIVPNPSISGRSVISAFWHYVAERRILDDAESWKIRDAIQEAVWNSGYRIVAQCKHLHFVYEFIGTEWLEEQASKTRKRKSGRRLSPEMMAEISPFVQGWIRLQQDLILEYNELEDEIIRIWTWLTHLSINLDRASPILSPENQADLRSRFRSEGYLQAAFELTVMNLFTSDGSVVSFVPTNSQEKKRSPDLLVKQLDLSFFVECCRKEPDSDSTKKSLNLAKKLAAEVLAMELRSNRSTSICLSFSNQLSHKIVEEAKQAISGLRGNGSIERQDFVVSASSLGDWNEVHDVNILRKSPSADFDLVYVGGDRLSSWSLSQIVHASVFATRIPCERDLFKSLKNTLKDKGEWISAGGQIPDGSIGVLAIGIGECSRATVTKIEPLVREYIENKRPALSAIVLLWEERQVCDGLTQMVETRCISIPNSRAKLPPPEALWLPSGQVQFAAFSKL